MSWKLYCRVVGPEELKIIQETKTIPPSKNEDWSSYPSWEVIFLYPFSELYFPINAVCERVQWNIDEFGLSGLVIFRIHENFIKEDHDHSATKGYPSVTHHGSLNLEEANSISLFEIKKVDFLKKDKIGF